MKKPNDYGLFDMLGNVWQWCDSSREYTVAEGGRASEDPGMKTDVRDKVRGTFPRRLVQPGFADGGVAHDRNCNMPTLRYNNIGFRVVRTLP